MSDEPIDVLFEGADGTIRFASDELEREFRRVVHGWPVDRSRVNQDPFAQVALEGARWSVDILRPERRHKSSNPVNRICDLIIELNWSRLRQNNELMCLHAAGIQMGEALVVFPSRRRAGKSTLTAELSRRGHRVFTDDILAVQLSSDGIAEGLATGVSPRLRLPLPPEASERFYSWVEQDQGPANKQYKYLTEAPVAGFDKAAPIGAIVTLNRVEEDVTPSFSDMDAKEVLPVLIHQNFGRFANSGRILSAFGAIARDLPCLKLTYGSFEQAADFLEEAVQKGLLAQHAVAEADSNALPDFERLKEPFEEARRYRQRAGFQCINTDDEAFVADANGVGIFRLGPGMIPIWLLLQEPVSLEEIIAVLSEVFPDVMPDTLLSDTRKAMRKLNHAGLIDPVD